MQSFDTPLSHHPPYKVGVGIDSSGTDHLRPGRPSPTLIPVDAKRDCLDMLRADINEETITTSDYWVQQNLDE